MSGAAYVGAAICQQGDLRRQQDLPVWQSGLCACSSVKDCGCDCCIKVCVGAPCIWGAAMQTLGRSHVLCCLALTLCPPCTLIHGRSVVAAHYGIEESGIASLCLGVCYPVCSYLQLVNQVLVKEDKTWACCSVAGPGAPDACAMRR